jgi:hypothetical protein
VAVPENNEMKRTKPGPVGASPLISVLGRRRRTPAIAAVLIATLLQLAFPDTAPAATHTLTRRHRDLVAEWLETRPTLRLALPADCDCGADISSMKMGSTGLTPVRDYNPYVAIGDFNGDAVDDLAVVVVDRERRDRPYSLVVFNGPLNHQPRPAFIQGSLDLRHQGLFFNLPGAPGRLQLGGFETEASLLEPKGNSYELVYSED